MDNIEVNQEPHRFSAALEIGNDLGVVHWRDCLDRLNFHDYEIFDEQIETIPEFQLDSSIYNGQRRLRSRIVALDLQLCCRQAVYVLSSKPVPSSV